MKAADVLTCDNCRHVVAAGPGEVWVSRDGTHCPDAPVDQLLLSVHHRVMGRTTAPH